MGAGQALRYGGRVILLGVEEFLRHAQRATHADCDAIKEAVRKETPYYESSCYRLEAAECDRMRRVRSRSPHNLRTFGLPLAGSKPHRRWTVGRRGIHLR